MAKIALGMHVESTLHHLQFQYNNLNERLTQQQILLNELRQFNQTTSTKAELHAAMASLQYKNMGQVLNRETLHDVIKNKFAKSEEIRPSEVKGYLANPFEALASMAEKIKKMEILRQEEVERQEQETFALKEEINLLKRILTDQDHRVSQLYTDLASSVMSIQRLQHQQNQPQKSTTSGMPPPSAGKPPILTSGFEERTQKEREDFLDQPLDMETYWNIPEEEGLDDIELSEERVEDEVGDDSQSTFEAPDIQITTQAFDSHIITPLPHIPAPDEATSASLLTPSNPSQDPQQSHSESLPQEETNTSSTKTTPHSDLQDLAQLEQSTSSRRKDSTVKTGTDRKTSSASVAVAPAEPISSRRNTHRPSFMSMRRKLSQVNAIAQPEEQIAPPTKARTSMVKTIQKTESLPLSVVSNFVTISQLQEFRQERIAVEVDLRNRLKSVEHTSGQVNTLSEALKILSEEIRVTSEELTGQIKKDIVELREGQLHGFQEIFKIVENCWTNLKQLQAAGQSKQKGNASPSFGVESIQHEIRILQQNMESLRTQVIIQSTKQRDPPPLETPADRGAPAIVPAGVAEEEVMKIASNINKLDNSVNQLNKRCNTLHEEFLTQRDALQEQLQTLPPASVPNTGINPLERNLPQEIRHLHEFHESKMQELQSISEEIKHLQEGLSTVKAASSELFDKYHIRPTVFLDQQESSTTKTPLTDSFPDSIPRLEQYAFNDHRIKLIQSDIMELREKIEQIYYLSLSAVSVAQGRHEAPPRIKQDEEKKLQVSFHHLSFPENNPKKETKSSLPPRPSVSASSTRKKPNLHHGNQRPNSSTGISRALTSSENLLTPPSVSFVDTIEPPIRPPRNPVAPVHRIAVNSRPKSQPQQSTPLQQQLLLLAGGSLTENSVTSGVLIPPFDDLRIGESNSSVWERDLSLSPNNQSEINNLPHALLYGSLTVRDAVKYDKENDHDETWYRSYQLPSGNALRVSGISDSSRPQGTEQGGYVSSLAEYTGNWKVPSFVNN